MPPCPSHLLDSGAPLQGCASLSLCLYPRVISIPLIPSHQAKGSISVDHSPFFITARPWRQPGLKQKSHSTTYMVTRHKVTASPSWEIFLPLTFQSHIAQLLRRTRLNLHIPCAVQATEMPRRCLVLPELWKPQARDKSNCLQGNITETSKNPTGECSWSMSPSQGVE